MDSKLVLYWLIVLIIGATLVDIDMLLDCQLILPLIETNMTNQPIANRALVFFMVIEKEEFLIANVTSHVTCALNISIKFF